MHERAQTNTHTHTHTHMHWHSHAHMHTHTVKHMHTVCGEHGLYQEEASFLCGVSLPLLSESFVSPHPQAPPPPFTSPPMGEPSGVDLIGWRSKPGQGSVARLPSDK
jgi:hypothetical protein